MNEAAELRAEIAELRARMEGLDATRIAEAWARIQAKRAEHDAWWRSWMAIPDDFVATLQPARRWWQVWQ